MVLYPARVTPDHKFVLTAQDSTTLKLPVQLCTPTRHRAEPYAWALSAIQLHHPAATVASVLMEILLFFSIIRCTHTHTFQQLGK